MKINSRKRDASGDSDELRELLGAVGQKDKAAYFGVTVATLQRWLDGKVRPPRPVLLLARLQVHGDLSWILGREWAEVSISQAGMTLPGWKRPFQAGEIRSTFMQVQRLTLLEHENNRLRRERAAAWAAQEAAQAESGYYRRQLRLESRLGAMLQGITA